MTKIFDYNRHDHKIKYHDVTNGLKSKYGDAIRDLIDFCKFSVDGVPKNDIHLVNGLEYTLLEDEGSKDKKTRIPFEDGHISTDDLQYIVENKIESTEIAKYTDGWYHAFSYMELYEHYDFNEL